MAAPGVDFSTLTVGRLRWPFARGRSLRGLGLVILRRLADAATVSQLRADEHVVQEGFSAEAFFVVLTGRVVVRRAGEIDRPLARGDWFGELGLLDGAPRTASVVTTSEAWLLKLGRPDFLGLLDRYASIGRGVAEGLAARLREVYVQHGGPPG